MTTDTILKVNNLHVSFRTLDGIVDAVRGVTFDLKRGETLAIVGESGSGKSVSMKAINRVLPRKNTIFGKDGEIIYEGKNLLSLPEEEMESIRGRKIAMIFQDPMTSLNPTMTVGRQIAESILHLFANGFSAFPYNCLKFHCKIILFVCLSNKIKNRKAIFPWT